MLHWGFFIRLYLCRQPMLNVHYLSQFVAKADLAESTVIVVDLLRASSTICFALANGAEAVRPYTEIDATFAAAADYQRASILLGGERGGQPIEGFDLGNSPTEYSSYHVLGKRVLFTTTNGTKAIEHAELAERVLIGATVNRRAVAEAVSDAKKIDILCAGTNGMVTREDVLAAGAIVTQLQGMWSENGRGQATNEWADASAREWQELETIARVMGRTTSKQLAEELRSTTGGKNLLAIGRDEDLPVCAQLDALEAVPELNQATGDLVLA